MPDLKANASPTKAFFVRMLTRDISLTDCILDLVDNSIDGAWQSSGHVPDQLVTNKDLRRYEIHIEADEDRFVISDNCGGISLDEAVNYAFTFGRMDEQPKEDFSVGVYGIGMKRAVFKMGRDVQIQSTYSERRQKRRAFAVSIPVEEWLADRSSVWDFDLVETVPSDESGVTIVVTDLLPGIREQFGDAEYLRDLRRTLARDYLLPLLRGLRLTLNGEKISAREPSLRDSDDLAPMRHRYEDDGVTVEIFAGMWRLPSDDMEPEEESRIDSVSGWYVLCNGRAVLSADRSSTTGWGDDLPRWHPQYGGFVGFALFSSTHSELLPMTTTKRSVDTSSPIYLRALSRMHEPTRAWIDYTNQRKRDLDGVKLVEKEADAKALSAVATSPSVILPKVQATRTTRVANVNYAVPVTRMRALASAFGDRNLSYREVGLESFDFSYENLVEEPE